VTCFSGISVSSRCLWPSGSCGRAYLVEEDVLGLDVAVDDLAAVQERDAPRHVQRDAAAQTPPAQLPGGSVVVDGHPQVPALKSQQITQLRHGHRCCIPWPYEQDGFPACCAAESSIMQCFKLSVMHDVVVPCKCGLDDHGVRFGTQLPWPVEAKSADLHELGDERQAPLPQADAVELEQVLRITVAQHLRSAVPVR